MAYFFDVQVAILGTPIKYQAPVGFTAALDMTSFGGGLLGQHGFFDRFKVCFDRANGLFVLDAP
jgi:hypothetical protein